MIETGKPFHFFVNKLENNTIQLSPIFDASSGAALNNANKAYFNSPDIDNFFSSLNNYYDSAGSSNGSNSSSPNAFYDPSGAAKYIVVVVLVYGFGIIFFIASQVRSSQKMSDEVDGVNAEKILRSMETEIFTKEVLEKLSNKEHRERAWKIYLSDNTTTTPSTASSPNNVNNKLSGDNEPLLSTPNSPISLQLEPSTKFQFTETNEAKLKKILDNEDVVLQIEKKLRILNKLQSSYKHATVDAEIETVKEALEEVSDEPNGAMPQRKLNRLRSLFRKRESAISQHQQQAKKKSSNASR